MSRQRTFRFPFLLFAIFWSLKLFLLDVDRFLKQEGEKSSLTRDAFPVCMYCIDIIFFKMMWLTNSFVKRTNFQIMRTKYVKPSAIDKSVRKKCVMYVTHTVRTATLPVGKTGMQNSMHCGLKTIRTHCLFDSTYINYDIIWSGNIKEIQPMKKSRSTTSPPITYDICCQFLMPFEKRMIGNSINVVNKCRIAAVHALRDRCIARP